MYAILKMAEIRGHLKQPDVVALSNLQGMSTATCKRALASSRNAKVIAVNIAENSKASCSSS